MSANKTEKPTPKKKRDAAKEGQTFKSKDLIASCLILIGIEVILGVVSLREMVFVFTNIINADYSMSPHEFAVVCFLFGAKILAPVLAMGIVATVFPGLAQVGGQLALKALKIKFDAINPVKGIKKIFNLRTIKELVKALLFLAAFAAAFIIFWGNNRTLIISMVHGQANGLFQIWGTLLRSLLHTFILCILLIVIFDCICEFLLWLKEIKMDKKEVEREGKELNGNPEIKSKRKELHKELLSEGQKDAVRKSKAVIANPTHITVGIYINEDITFIPFISLIETEAKALAVRRYAKQVGIPVIEDIALARKLYATHKVNSFVDLECFPRILDLFLWLDILEESWLDAMIGQTPPATKPTVADAPDTPPLHPDGRSPTDVDNQHEAISSGTVGSQNS